MTFVEKSTDGTLNGTTEVVLVEAPASGVRRVIKTINIHNSHNASLTLTVNYVNDSNNRKIWSGSLAAGDTWIYGEGGEILILNTPAKSIRAVLSTNPATQPDWVASWAEIGGTDSGSGEVPAGAAPDDGYYLVRSASASLTNSQNLASLGAGLLKQTVSGGVATVSVAVDGTDYLGTSGHDDLRTLAHNILDSHYEEYTYSGSQILSVVDWTSASKVEKIRESLFSYSGENISQEINIQYEDGVEVHRLTKSFTYSNGQIVSITVVES